MSRKNIIIILFLGSLWGFSEVIFGEALYSTTIRYPSVILSIFALFILGISYRVIGKVGSATIIATIASLFRIINAGPFYCHLLAVFLLGVSFDIITYFIKEKKLVWFSGILSAWLGYILFGFSITYIFRYQYWITEGLPKVIRYIGIEGSLAAFGSSISVMLGYKFGKNIEKLFNIKPRLAYISLIILTVCFWIIGRV